MAESVARVEAAAEAVRQELSRSAGRSVRVQLSVVGEEQAPDQAERQIRHRVALGLEVDAYEEVMSATLQVRLDCTLCTCPTCTHRPDDGQDCVPIGSLHAHVDGTCSAAVVMVLH